MGSFFLIFNGAHTRIRTPAPPKKNSMFILDLPSIYDGNPSTETMLSMTWFRSFHSKYWGFHHRHGWEPRKFPRVLNPAPEVFFPSIKLLRTEDNLKMSSSRKSIDFAPKNSLQRNPNRRGQIVYLLRDQINRITKSCFRTGFQERAVYHPYMGEVKNNPSTINQLVLLFSVLKPRKWSVFSLWYLPEEKKKTKPTYKDRKLSYNWTDLSSSKYLNRDFPIPHQRFLKHLPYVGIRSNMVFYLSPFFHTFY